ncbi:LysR family transcriptional regulator [Breoghania sp.]|uniref:winged helix-turn-helix domain-containing protein n=1 Tax=Breoghania sp. TaxID=2065378 RepID=UPI00261F2AAC|nr:LysR family transcriptional regulator [Breoghania sp.]MDJ0931315.1 LysR family transcriptional regulator [Breoghania sp.]
MSQHPPPVRPIFAMTRGEDHRVGEDRFRLLEAIDRLDSISAAAKEVGLSYRTAWDATNALNNLFARPLVIARPGGHHGGSAEVTVRGVARCAFTDASPKALDSFSQSSTQCFPVEDPLRSCPVPRSGAL